VAGEILGDPCGDPVVGYFLDVGCQFRLVDRLGLLARAPAKSVIA
jgi:hypothetical protein